MEEEGKDLVVILVSPTTTRPTLEDALEGANGKQVAVPPQQEAKVIEGHHLRSNQYLLGRVYDEEAAKANWQKAVLKRARRGEEDATTERRGRRAPFRS